MTTGSLPNVVLWASGIHYGQDTSGQPTTLHCHGITNYAYIIERSRNYTHHFALSSSTWLGAVNWRLVNNRDEHQNLPLLETTEYRDTLQSLLYTSTTTLFTMKYGIKSLWHILLHSHR